MVGDGVVGFVGVFAEPEVGVLDPLDVGVGFAGGVEVEVGVDVPGEEVAGIAAEEVEVGVAGGVEEGGGDVLGYPADAGVEEFGDDVGLASVDGLDGAVGFLAGLEALADEEAGGDVVGAAGGGEDEGEAAAVGVEAAAAGGGGPGAGGGIAVTAVVLEPGVEALAVGDGRFVVMAAHSGGIEPGAEGVGVPVDRFGGGEEVAGGGRDDGGGGRGGGPVDELAGLEGAGDFDVPMDAAGVAAVVVEGAGVVAVGRAGVVGFELAFEGGGEVFDVLAAGVGGDGEVEDGAVTAAGRPGEGAVVGDEEAVAAGDLDVLWRWGVLGGEGVRDEAGEAEEKGRGVERAWRG